MKIVPLISILLSALCGSLSAKSPQGIMYVGDSLTHGYSSSSYRWHLHKMLVDSGFAYEELGVVTGNTGQNRLAANSSYRGVPFHNRHASQSSARAWEISGYRAGPRFGGSNVENWLGQDVLTAARKSYQGKKYVGEDAPDIFVLMIGSNDLLSDNEKEPQGLPAVASREIKELLGNVNRIVKAMQKANPKAHIYLLTVPAWAKHPLLDIMDWRKAVDKYNKALARWARTQKNVKLINTSRGLVADGLAAEQGFYLSDGLHFNEQGNLLIAGNIAHAMGLEGRTAGLTRRGEAELQAAEPDKGDDALTLILKANGVGSYILSNGRKSATLIVEGRRILWQSGGSKKLLYAGNLAKEKDMLRVAWVQGDVDEGYYVWLGNQLIGEALPSESSKRSKSVIPSKGSKAQPLLIKGGSYAPA